MNASKGQLIVAVIAVASCIGLWYTRLADPEEAVVKAPPVARAVVPTPGILPPAPVNGIAPTLTTIAWRNPENPASIPLSVRDKQFLFETTNGLNVWHAESLKMEPLQHPYNQARLVEKIWMRARSGMNDYGTLFAVDARDAGAATTLYLLQDAKTQVTEHFDLPENFILAALVRLSDDTALLCSTGAQRTLFVRVVNGQIKKMDSASGQIYLLPLLKEVGVIGQLEGIGRLGDPGLRGYPDYERPVLFDVDRCAWTAKWLPDPLASADRLDIHIRYIQSFQAPSVVSARWVDRTSGEPRTLDAPLIWRWRDRHWLARQAADYSMLAPSQLSGVLYKEWSYAADLSQGRFAFYAPVDERWRNSTLRLPPAESLKVLPIGAEGVLALLIDSREPGRIVRLDPAGEEWPKRRLPHSVGSYFEFVPMRGGELMLTQGGEASYVSIIRPDGPSVESLPSLPQPQEYVSGVQLDDDSVVVFGGLHPSCFKESPDQCSHGVQPSYRWIPSEKRWQPLPTLKVPFSTGRALDGGNYVIPRSDFLVYQGREIYFLSSQTMKRSGEAAEAPSQLNRWSLDRGTETLAVAEFARNEATLLDLDDGRLAVVGGSARNEPASPVCQACERTRQAAIAQLREKMDREAKERSGSESEEDFDPDQELEELVPPCNSCTVMPPHDDFTFARSSEIYDPRTNRWIRGPYANHFGGRALKLANGRLFKIGLLGYSAEDADYVAETADPSLTKWTAAPPFPLPRPAEVRTIAAIGDQVLIVMAKPADRYVIWDDDRRSWQVHPLPRHADWGLRHIPVYVGPAGDDHVLATYSTTYEYLPWPLQ